MHTFSLLAAVFAAISLVSPQDGATVALVSDVQKTVMAPEKYTDRLAILQEDRLKDKKLRHDPYWNRALPVVFSWSSNDATCRCWALRLGTRKDLSDARVEILRGYRAKDGHVTYTLPCANLEIGRTYYWQVIANDICEKFAHGRPPCDCKDRPPRVVSPVASFTTEDVPPRWIEIEGRTKNFRDLGGWKTTAGKTVRQGLVYRCQGLNDNSPDNETEGRNRLTVEDVKYLTGAKGLGIKTDLDLRSDNERKGMTASPLGPTVTFIPRASQAYNAIFTDGGKKVMAENFRVFCDKANYPIVFHCIGGADRTGSLAYVLNGVLGVAKADLERDWEQTFYPRELPEMMGDWKPWGLNGERYWRHEFYFDEGFAKYGKPTDSWQRRIELYLLDCGVTAAEIARFRALMLK